MPAVKVATKRAAVKKDTAPPGIFLHIKELRKTYKNGRNFVHALDGFSLDAGRGLWTVIAGKSGCGKTTLLKCAAGLETPDAGIVEFTGGGRPQTGFMFQDPRLLPWLTVEENLRLALPPPKGSAALRNERDDRIMKTLALVGLEGWEKAFPRRLSGGMAQRASLARALCGKPELLLLDEPLSALDSLTRKRLRRELEGITRELGLTAILVTHDIEEAVYLGDKVVLMEQGTIAAEFEIPFERPRDYRDGAFQRLRAEIEERAER